MNDQMHVRVIISAPATKSSYKLPVYQLPVKQLPAYTNAVALHYVHRKLMDYVT